MDYLDAIKIKPGDTIRYQEPGEPERTATVVGPIHDFSFRPGQVVYVPTPGHTVNRLYIIEAFDAEPVSG